MPRKRKTTSVSPIRKPSTTPSAIWPNPPAPSSEQSMPQAMSNNNNEGLLSSMCDMFPNLDPTLVDMVLSEYKEVDVVMDYLLELSNAAKDEAMDSTEKSGFDTIVSTLGYNQGSEKSTLVEQAPDEPSHFEDICSDMTLTNDLDSLLDEALDRYSSQVSTENVCDSEQCYMAVAGASNNIEIPELVQATSNMDTSFPLQHSDKHDEDQTSMYLSSPSTDNKLSDDSCIKPTSEPTKESKVVMSDNDFLVALSKLSKDCLSPVASKDSEKVEKIEKSSVQKGRPISIVKSRTPANASSNGPRTNGPLLSQPMWNPLASPFYPVQSQLPRFLTPVVTSPLPWKLPAAGRGIGGLCLNPSVPACSWNINRVSYVPKNVEKPKPTVSPEPSPIQTTPPAPIIFPLNPKRITHFRVKVLMLLRGAPGSGKTTLARQILQHNPVGCILSTDDYFKKDGQYHYDPNCLGEAHAWNHKRAKEAFEKGISPIIIDNTNLQGWEMKPYVSLAVQHKYKVMFREPSTRWKFNPKELEKKNSHGVTREKISRMLEYYERSVGVCSILNLPKKEHKVVHGRERKLGDGDGQNSILPSDLKTDVTEGSFTGESENESVSDPDTAKYETFSDVAESRDCLISPGRDILSPGLSEASLEEENAYKEDNLTLDGLSLQPDERPELLNFVGDWPVEQTMNQRAPRNRKKGKANIMECSVMYETSAQHIDEKENCNKQGNETSKQDFLLPEFNEELDHSVDVEPVGNSELSQNSNQFSQTNILELEKEVPTLLESFQNDEDKPKREGQDDLKGVNESSEVLHGEEKVIENMQNTEISNQNNALLTCESTNKKPRQSKRNCRQCKLALTFRNSSFESKEDQSTCQAQETENSYVETSKCSQTEPHEFALAWRVEKNNMDISDSTKILTGRPERFETKLLDPNSNSQEAIPYRVMHDKSTLVEENELISLGDQDSLNILCKLFRSVSFDVLKDLFDRCNKDIVWATNLLLDSGEKFYREDDCDVEELKITEEITPAHLESCCHLDEDLEICEQTSKLYHKSYIPADGYIFSEQTEQVQTLAEKCDLINIVPLDIANDLRNIISSPITDEKKFNQSEVNHKTTVEIPPISASQASDLDEETLNISDLDFNTIVSSVLDADDSQEIYNPDTDRSLNINLQNEEDEKNTGYDKEDKMKKSNSGSLPKQSLHFDHLELSLTPELAFQLSELFGPVGIHPGSLTIDDCVVRIDLNLAKSIHKRWKESVMERDKQEILSYQLLFEANFQLDHYVAKEEPSASVNAFTQSQSVSEMLPFMDQWNTKTKKVSLRQIMSEEIAFQEQEDLKRSPLRKNCAEKLKEKQLFEMFPYIEQKLLMEFFMENNYSLEKTKQFMCSVLEADPVQNVTATDLKHSIIPASEKCKEIKKSKVDIDMLGQGAFQDFDYPDYDDFRAEAFLYRKKQQESFRKAEEAHNRGMNQVATYYAHQGYLYGQKMKEENHRAALQIFQRANEFLLPENILDLHGLHVDEAMKHFKQVLQDKMEEYKQNGGKPYLSVITGRGNHSQGGVARIKPAVIDYLTNHDFRFLEIRAGVLRVTLK
ncbi:LOW QUALITY PROTEIN: NEDD4-binding protein 2 [Discoglossus pictus]